MSSYTLFIEDRDTSNLAELETYTNKQQLIEDLNALGMLDYLHVLVEISYLNGRHPDDSLLTAKEFLDRADTYE